MPESTLTPAPVSAATFPNPRNAAIRSMASAEEICGGEKEADRIA